MRGGSSNFSVYDATSDYFWNGSPSSTRVGWTIGGGVEYAITNNITIKGEYLYVNLGSKSSNTNTINILGVTPVYRDGQNQLRRLDLPRGHQLQVLIASI